MKYGIYYYKEVLTNYDSVIVKNNECLKDTDSVYLYDDMDNIAFVKVINEGK